MWIEIGFQVNMEKNYDARNHTVMCRWDPNLPELEVLNAESPQV